MTMPKKMADDHSAESQRQASVINDAITNMELDHSAQAASVLKSNRPSSREDSHPMEMDSKGEPINWQKVGRIYKPGSAIEDIVEKEVGRIKRSFNHSIEEQDVALEEKNKNLKKK